MNIGIVGYMRVIDKGEEYYWLGHFCISSRMKHEEVDT